MEDLKEKTGELVDHVEQYASTWFKLALLNVTEKATNAVSYAVVIVAFTILGMSGILFLGIALSLWLGDLVGNRALGFVLGGAGFLLLFVIILILRRNIVFPFIRDTIIKKVYDK